MGRLEDIVARNQKALRARRSLRGMAIDFIEDIFDPEQAPEDRKRKITALVVVLGVVGAVIAAWIVLRRPSDSAPDGTVIDRHGKRVELSSLWRDHRVVVAFYPTFGCGECRAGLMQLNEHLAEMDATVIAISAERSAQIAERHEELGLAFEVYADPTLAVFPAWGIPYQQANTPWPATFVVEPGGRISYRKICDAMLTCPVLRDLVPATHR